MAHYDFGIMNRAPEHGERYDSYEPEKYSAIAVLDDAIEPVLTECSGLDCFWHTLDWPAKGFTWCGITLIPPESAEEMASIIADRDTELRKLAELLTNAGAQGKFVICFGI